MRTIFRIVINNRRHRTTLAQLITHITISLLFLSNPITHAQTHFTGDPTQPVTTDYYHFQWNLWWTTKSIQQHIPTYSTNYLLNPFENNLALHTLTPTATPIWAATIDTLQPSGAILTILFASLTLTGFTTTILLQHHKANHILATAGGMLLQTSAIMYESSKWTTLNLMGWFWIPLTILTWQQLIQSAQTHRTKHKATWTVILGITLWAMVLTDLQYPLFLAPLIIPYAIWTLTQIKNQQKKMLIITLSTTGILIAIALLWLTGPLQYILNYNTNTLASTPANRAPAIPFPNGYFWRLDRGISLGFTPILLVVLSITAILHNRQRRPQIHPWLWLGIAIPPLILSAGSSITILGSNIPMPYLWLHELLRGVFRYPERFANVFLFAILLFTTPILSQHVPKRGWKRYITGITLIILTLIDTRTLQPIPLQPIPHPYTFYERMGAETYDYVIVEIPTAGSSGEGIVGRSEWVALQWYGIIHGKRMVNAHISRVDPWHYLWMETSDPMMSWLGQRRFIEPETVAQQMHERISSWPIGYFIIHTNFLPQNGPTLQEIIGFFNEHGELVCPYTTEDDAIVYRTTWHPDGCPERTPTEIAPNTYEIDLGTSGDERFIGWGWHWQEDIGATQWRWTGEYPQADIFVDLPPTSYQMTLSAQAFWEPRTLQIKVNGESLPETALISTDSLQTYSFHIPSSILDGGTHTQITLQYDDTLIPIEVSQSGDTRRLAIAIDWIRFEAASQ